MRITKLNIKPEVICHAREVRRGVQGLPHRCKLHIHPAYDVNTYILSVQGVT